MCSARVSAPRPECSIHSTALYNMICFVSSLLLLHLIQNVLATCPIEKSAVPATNAQFISTTWADDNKLALADDTQFVLKCTEANHVFVNSVRAVDNVNITSLDSSGQVTGTCTVNNMIPNIFVTDRVYNSYNDRTRKFYCARGCNPLKPAGQTISYPSTLLGNEANSPPIRVSDEIVTVKCAAKYAQAVGDSGASETQCTKNGWSKKSSELVKCVNGCPDVRKIDNGKTRATLTGSEGESPFIIGDIIPFECEEGYVLVGYRTLTCTSDYKWSDNIPECVQVALAEESSSTATSGSSSTTHSHMINILLPLIVWTIVYTVK